MVYLKRYTIVEWPLADKDLAAKVRGRKESYEIGTDEYTKHTKDMTPGQKESISFKNYLKDNKNEEI